MELDVAISSYDSPWTAPNIHTCGCRLSSTSNVNTCISLPPTNIPISFNQPQSEPYALRLDPHEIPVSMMSQTSDVPQLVYLASDSGVGKLPTEREARNAVCFYRDPMVRSGNDVPTFSNPMFSEVSYFEEPDRSRYEPNKTTNVDLLMRPIQAKQTTSSPKLGIAEHDTSMQITQKPKNNKHVCKTPNCGKAFYQQAHLETYNRAHTGAKPFHCTAPGCGQSFSQPANLKTHERRHNGERPYSCIICGKAFAQYGNILAHKIVHQENEPFTCKLDGCGKKFKMLGNSKSQQNKFHTSTLRYLAQKFATNHPDESVSNEDKEFREHFELLYKNSNKGITERGKGRSVSTAPSSNSSHHPAEISSHMNISTVSGDMQHESDSRFVFDASVLAAYQVADAEYDNLVFPERRLAEHDLQGYRL